MLAAQLLAATTPAWLAAHRHALAQRRDHLAALPAAHLPAWRAQQPRAGVSLWPRLPPDSANPLAHAPTPPGLAAAAHPTADPCPPPPPSIQTPHTPSRR